MFLCLMYLIPIILLYQLLLLLEIEILYSLV
jgi:hypothetical protein